MLKQAIVIILTRLMAEQGSNRSGGTGDAFF
jgi:hypothetical protein